MQLVVTSVPAGEAPLWVREKWVGLALQVTQRKSAPHTYLTSGVLSGPKTILALCGALLGGKLQRRTGFRVEARVAIAVLAKASPEAAAWWRENTPHEFRPGRYFVFEQGVGHISEDDGGA